MGIVIDDSIEEMLRLGIRIPDDGPVERGGPGSGHFGHKGRPGERGGSQPSDLPAHLLAENDGPIDHIINTADLAPGTDLGSAAVATDHGTLEAFHVSDTGQTVMDRLRKGLPITEGRREGKYGDLGRGLYSSYAPQLWMSRSTGKYRFLDNMTPDQRESLLDKISTDLLHSVQDHYISESEYSYAMKDVDAVSAGKVGPETLVHIAGQPYNVHFWKPAYLEGTGLKATEPKVIPVEMKGTFAQMTRMPSAEEAEAMIKSGLDGAYMPSSFSGYPQIVVYNNDAVVRFGDYQKSD